MIQFDDNNHPIIRSKLIDLRHITLLPFHEVASLANLREEDRAVFMSELQWIDDDFGHPPHTLIDKKGKL